MTGLLVISPNGEVTDTIVEKMFSDIFHGTYIEDEITLNNMNVYLAELYGEEHQLKSLDDCGELLSLALDLFNVVSIVNIEDDRGETRIGVQLGHWDRTEYATSPVLTRALALAIVQDMRYYVKTQLNDSTGTTH